MFYLMWKGEIIEDDIDTIEEAEYLLGEYNLAYKGGVTVHMKGGII